MFLSLEGKKELLLERGKDQFEATLLAATL